MAGQNPLKPLFSDIANAIREKDGSTGTIPAKDFPERIRAIGIMPDNVHTITLEADPPEGGSVSGDGIASAGMTVTVEAESGSNYAFDGWKDDSGNTIRENPYVFKVSADKKLTAQFSAYSGLPEGYTELEYIKTDNNCGIDTQQALTLNTSGFVMDIVADALEATNGEYIVDINTTLHPYFTMYRSSETVLTARVGSSSTYKKATLSITNEHALISFENGTLSINGTEIYSTTDTKTTASNLFLFKSPAHSAYESIKAKLYSAQMFESGDLVRDFVPCINPSGKVGLYDMVSGTFFGNSLSGILSPGPAI